MNQPSGFYSLIQFCPNLSRLESINVGIVVYSSRDMRLQVQMTKGYQRIRKFFGTQDWHLIKRAKASIKSQMTSQRFLSVEDLKAYIAKRANIIQMTPPRSVEISDLTEDTRRLYRELVETESIDRKDRVDVCLTNRLAAEGVIDLVRKSINVRLPGIGRSIRAPYGYQNGRFNLISPVQFEDSEFLIAKMGKSAIEGELLYEKSNPEFGEMRLVVVANFDNQIDSAARDLVVRTLKNHQVTTYLFDNLDPLMEDIRSSAALHRKEREDA